MRYWAALYRINTLTSFPWRWCKHRLYYANSLIVPLRHQCLGCESATVLTANAARRDINNYIAEAVELFAAAPPAHAAAAAACQAIPWSYEPSTRFALTLETAKMNSHPWTSYSTSYTLWGLSRRSLAVLRCELTIAPIISGVGLKKFCAVAMRESYVATYSAARN